MSQTAYTLVGLTALLAGLVAVLVFAVLRFGSAVRDMRRQVRDGSTDRTFVAAALEDAIRSLKDQERAMSERALTSERLSGQIVNSLTSGLLVVGLPGDVRMINPAARRLLHVATHEGDVRGFRELLVQVGGVADVIEECLSTAQAVVRRSVVIARQDRGPAYLGVTVSPLCDDHQQLQGAICLFSDLTSVVQLEEQVRLKESLARLGELTAGLAHEFRNGLATIHGYGRLIEPARLPPEYGPYVQAIRDETETLGRVVTNFLNFARPVELTLTPLRLETVVQEVVEELQGEIEARGATVTVEGQFGVVEGDPVLLRQALNNLVRNGLESCAEIGTRPRVVIGGTEPAGTGTVVLRVTDNGPGIDPALREKVFQPFFTTRREGIGLGLALVQKIIVTHNGRVKASASEQGGASFEVTLPAAHRAAVIV